MLLNVRTVFGVDFSGAAKAGLTAWVSENSVEDDGRLRLLRLRRLADVTGSADREMALAGLVAAIRQSHDALWAIDFPFGLPLELGLGGWCDQLRLVRAWDGGAPAFGHHCLATSKQRNGRGHVRRQTDVEEKAPFDCYHYRIIYQTFHGMRDVLGPLEDDAATAVLPFDHVKPSPLRAVAEACPSSTLKRLGLPHQNYKQPGGKSPDALRLATRRVILKALQTHVDIGPSRRRRLLADPGGDALDAVLAAVGGWHGFATLGVGTSGGDRYAREGRIYA